ncbi:repeat element protein-d6.3 [Ichnoviriform fugitivi]|uniref:Repeat element protein-d6.3 n=1 Tax=Ichnoviriform fugitivi TaxID=265522 RepID=A2Q0L2_9VIRU|nr:repeat element protein-d6.3 [Ichnoviriform fugitivi]BAF45727.1 repeat element protein-d6.3 [Ichnoviriform fugitivi]
MNNSRKRKMSRSRNQRLPSVLPSEEQPVLPDDEMLCVSKYLSFADFRNFVRSRWPRTKECPRVIRRQLWRMSTHKIETTFINGKRIKIEYNFDPSRRNKDQVLINVKCLVSVFGGIYPTDVKNFTSVSELENFIKIHVHMNICSDHRHASCPCHLVNDDGRGCETFVKPSIVDECQYGHLHHYCWNHVKEWLHVLRDTLIERQRTGIAYSEDMADACLRSLDEIVYLRGVGMRFRGPLLYRLV